MEEEKSVFASADSLLNEKKEGERKYPKFRISSVYDFLECEKRFYLIETGRSLRPVTIEMRHGRRDHAAFEARVMALPEAFEIVDLRDGFLKANALGRQTISSEIPVKIHDHEFKLFISGKIDAVAILPQENMIKIIENKPRLSEYALLQGLLYGYTVRRILGDLAPRIVVEIRNTKSQEIFADQDYRDAEDGKMKKILERIGLILHGKVGLDALKRCMLPDCVCKRIWW